MLVCLKRLVIFLIFGLWNVKMANLLKLSFFGSVVCAFCCSFLFIFVMSCSGKLLLLAVVSILCHSFFLLAGVSLIL